MDGSRWRRSLATLLVVAAVHGALWWVYTQRVAVRHRVALHDLEFLGSTSALDVLFVGDSHPRSAVEARMLGPGALNIAVGGEHTLKTLHRVRWLLDQSPRTVGTVVLAIESHTFVDWKVDAYQPEYVWGRYIDYLALGQRRGQPFPYLARWLKAWVVPYAGELDTLAQYAVGGRGFRDRDALKAPPRRDDRRHPEEAAREHFEDRNPLDPDLRWALETLVADLQARGIRVVLVSYPVSQPYAEYADRFGARPAVRERVLPGLVASGLTWLDHEDLFFGRPDAWFDADHMSASGRHEYTRRLAWDLVDLGVLSSPPRGRRPQRR